MSSVSELKLDFLVTGAGRSSRWPISLAAIISLVVIIDAAIIALSSLISGWVYDMIVMRSAHDATTSLTVSFIVFTYFLLVSTYQRNYAIEHLASRDRQIHETASAWTLVFLVLLVTAFFFKVSSDISRGTVLLFFVVGGGSLLGWRVLLANVLIRARAGDALAATNVVLLSAGAMTQSLRSELRTSGLRVTKLFVLDHDTDLRNLAQQVSRTVIGDSQVKSILVALPLAQYGRIQQLLSELAIVPLPIRLLPDPHVAAFIGNPVVQVGTLRAAEIQRMPLSVPEQISKRAFDIVSSVCLGLLLSPLLMLVAILIKLDSFGPVIFTQARNGFNNRTFRIYKFRTLLTLEDGAVIKQVIPNDPRLTRIGRVLRRLSIDELPQLLNVLKGEMSLIGPRPHAVAHNSQYAASIDNYAFRHHVKPGLSGWAQIHGLRGETRTLDAMQKRVDFDMWYINNWSLWLDCKIILHTLTDVLRQLRRDRPYENLKSWSARIG